MEQAIPQKRERLIDVLLRKHPLYLPRVGEVVEAILLKRERGRVWFDLGFFSGVLYGKELRESREALRDHEEGDVMMVKIVELENEEGTAEVSLAAAGREKVWEELEQVRSDQTLLSLPVLEANKGGLVIEWHGIKGFLPVSQLLPAHYPVVEGGDKQRIFEELQKFVGQEFSVYVLDANTKENKLIFSERGKTVEEPRTSVAPYKTGDVIEEAEITGVVDFGLFVKLNKEERPIEGLVHISEVDWSLVENLSDRFAVGDHIAVKVIGVDGDKISLSIKALKPDPWKEAALEKGVIKEGRVMKLSSIGAFVEIMPGISGLAHISEFGSRERMEADVEIGRIYPFQVTLFDPEHHKLALSFVKESPTTSSPL
ncbi:MAG: S1 RNA-binding domain-containing protein [Patescibacteria group bacterium]